MNSLFLLSAIFLILLLNTVAPVNALAAKISKDAMSKEELMNELMGTSKSKDDISLYSELVAYYQANDQRRFKQRLNTLVSKFPQSQFTDNALYLAGRQSMENRNYPEAIKYFQTVINQYPNSNRVVSAQFAKAVTYKKMNLNNQSKNVLREVQKRFPGSPESYRAANEIKITR